MIGVYYNTLVERATKMAPSPSDMSVICFGCVVVKDVKDDRDVKVYEILYESVDADFARRVLPQLHTFWQARCSALEHGMRTTDEPYMVSAMEDGSRALSIEAWRYCMDLSRALDERGDVARSVEATPAFKHGVELQDIARDSICILSQLWAHGDAACFCSNVLQRIDNRRAEHWLDTLLQARVFLEQFMGTGVFATEPLVCNAHAHALAKHACEHVLRKTVVEGRRLCKSTLEVIGQLDDRIRVWQLLVERSRCEAPAYASYGDVDTLVQQLVRRLKGVPSCMARRAFQDAAVAKFIADEAQKQLTVISEWRRACVGVM